MSNKETIIKKYGEDFYREIGRKGGKKSTTGGFASLAKTDPERLRKLASKGGSTSRKGKKSEGDNG